MKEAQPLVSVLMTAYNRQDYIAQSIESVLHSTYSNLELIIVDDGSKDDTVSVARRYAAQDSRIRVYVNEQNLGDYPNRNKAASYATGKYIKYLDSDDIMYPHCLDVMVSAMEQFPEAGFGLASKASADKPFPVCISPREAYLEHFYGYGHFDRAPGSSIIVRSVFEEKGGFKSKKYVGDTELWFILAQKYSLVKFQRDLIWDRIHVASEKEYEKRDKNAALRRIEMVEEFLTHKYCPLEKTQVDSILLQMKRKNLNSKILKWGKILMQRHTGKID